MKVIGFVVLMWAISSGTWWLFLLAFLLWQLGGDGSMLAAMWVESHIHHKDSDHGP